MVETVNMDMVENVNMVDSLDMMNLQKTFGDLKLLLLRMDKVYFVGMAHGGQVEYSEQHCNSGGQRLNLNAGQKLAKFALNQVYLNGLNWAD